MQPITYSLIVNVLSVLCLTGLAIFFNQPLMMQTHALQKFKDDDDDEPGDDEGRPMGFLTDLT